MLRRSNTDKNGGFVRRSSAALTLCYRLRRNDDTARCSRPNAPCVRKRGGGGCRPQKGKKKPEQDATLPDRGCLAVRRRRHRALPPTRNDTNFARTKATRFPLVGRQTATPPASTESSKQQSWSIFSPITAKALPFWLWGCKVPPAESSGSRSWPCCTQRRRSRTARMKRYVREKTR